jgi:hypothetical protein
MRQISYEVNSSYKIQEIFQYPFGKPSSGFSSPLCFMQMMVGRSVKTQLFEWRNLLVRRRHVSAVIGHLQVNKSLTEENEQTYTYAYISYISMNVFAVITRNVTDALEKLKTLCAKYRKRIVRN